MLPIVLPPNQPANRFYCGGAQISAFRGASPCGEYEPEDWVASITCCHGKDTLGLTKLENGTFLRDEIQTNAEQWLGSDHVEAFGTDTKLLVKLLDAGQRLPIHAHPHGDWAKRHLGARCGKAELWYILEGGVVHLGLRESITPERLRALVDTQDVDTLLSMMHQVSVEQHQAVYVPPGMLHAIGRGMLIAEVQEPSDLSVLCEWRGFAIDGQKDGHLGLGFDIALTAVETFGRTTDEIANLIAEPNLEGTVNPCHTQEYFNVEHHTVSPETSFAPGFGIMIVLEGEPHLQTATAGVVALHKGSTVVIPFAAGILHLRGKGRILMARPPSPG